MRLFAALLVAWLLAGCTAMSAADLDTLLRWLSPSLHPRLVVGSFSF